MNWSDFVKDGETIRVPKLKAKGTDFYMLGLALNKVNPKVVQ